jgi:hypothetical protein
VDLMNIQSLKHIININYLSGHQFIKLTARAAYISTYRIIVVFLQPGKKSLRNQIIAFIFAIT